MASSRLRLQLLGFVFDLLRSLVDMLNLLLDPQTLLPLAQDRDLCLSCTLLDLSHGSPVERR